MPKAKLSQIATTWLKEEDAPKERRVSKKGDDKSPEEQPKRKQTFNLRVDTIKRLWMQRIRTDKPLSAIMDALVLNHLPAVNLENLSKKEKK